MVGPDWSFENVIKISSFLCLTSINGFLLHSFQQFGLEVTSRLSLATLSASGSPNTPNAHPISVLILHLPQPEHFPQSFPVLAVSHCLDLSSPVTSEVFPDRAF